MEKSQIERSQLFLPLFVSWIEVQKYARTYMVGKVIEQNKFSIKILQLSLREQAQKVFITLRTSGTYDGDIEITAKPVFYQKEHKVVFHDLHLNMDTDNIFQKGMVLLLKGTIQSQLEKFLDIDLYQAQQQLVKLANLYLANFSPSPEIKVKSVLEEVHLKDMIYNAAGLTLQVAALGQLELFVGKEKESGF